MTANLQPVARTDEDGSESAVRLIGQCRSLFTRPEARTDAVPLPVGRRGLASTIGIAVQGLVRFVYSLLIGRTLPTGFLAATNSAISTALLATLLWPTSLGAAAAKFVAREAGDVELREALTRYIARLSLVTSAALGACVGLLTYFVLMPGQLVTAALVSLLTIAWSGYTFVRSVQYATGRVLRATVWDVVAFLVAVGGLVLVLVFDMRDLLLLPLTAGYLLYTAAGWPRAARGYVSRRRRAEINRFVAWGVLGSLATGGFLQLTMVLAYQTSDVASADAYAAALTLATPASMLGSVLSLLLLPVLSGAVGRSDLAALRRHTDIAHRGFITTIGGVFGVLVVGSSLLVSFIWPRISGALPVLQILLVATFLLTASTVVTESMRSYSDQGARAIGLIRIAGFVVGLGVAVALIPAMSVVGVALGYLAGMGVTSVLPMLLVWRRDRHEWGPLMIRVLAGVMFAGALVGLQFMIRSSAWLDIALMAAFVAGWGLLHMRDLVEVRRRLVTSPSGK